MKKLVYTLLVISSLVSCHEQPVIIPPFEPVVSNRVVLIEELTGVKCPNCPSGAAKLEALRTLYPNNMVTVAVHGDFLSDPLPESKYDFRNADAKALEQKLGWLGKPAAVFNRIHFDDAEYQGIDDVELWQDYLETLLLEPQEVNLNVKSSYDENTGNATFDITGLSNIDEINDFKVVVMLTESEIEDAQENQGVIIEEYTHNHVLRKIVTDLDGLSFTNELKVGTPFSKTIFANLPETLDGQWNSEHIEVVAFITRVVDNENIVIQAAQVELR